MTERHGADPTLEKYFSGLIFQSLIQLTHSILRETYLASNRNPFYFVFCRLNLKQTVIEAKRKSLV